MSWSFILDGVDVSEIAGSDDSKKTWTRRISRPSGGSIRMPSHLVPADVEEGVSTLLITDDDDEPRFQGRLEDSEDDGDENKVYTELKFLDPMKDWPKKIARDLDGDFSKPTFFTDYPQAPAMMAEIIGNSIIWEGPLDLDVGFVDTGGPDLNAAPSDFPLTLDDMRVMLLQSGFLDIVINPLLGSHTIGTVDLYNGDYGTDRSGSISLDYQTGLFNVKRFKRTISMKDVCNKLWYYLGPKCDDQHWRGNVTGDDPTLAYPPGGDRDIVAGNNPLGALRRDSIADYGELFEIRIYDDFGGDCVDDPFGTNNDFRQFYQRMWQNESLLRARPRRLISMEPVRGFFPDPFDANDIITVSWGNAIRGVADSGTQRVYEFTVEVDKAGVPSMTNIVTSADQDQL